MWLPSFTLTSLMDNGQIRFLNSSNDGLPYRMLWIVTKWKATSWLKFILLKVRWNYWVWVFSMYFCFPYFLFLCICLSHTHTYEAIPIPPPPPPHKSWHCPLNYPNNEITVFPSCERCKRWGFWMGVVCVCVCMGVGGVVFWEEVIAVQQRGERQFKIRITATEMLTGPLWVIVLSSLTLAVMIMEYSQRLIPGLASLKARIV